MYTYCRQHYTLYTYEQYSYSGIWVGSDVAEGKVSSINVGTCDQVYGGNAPDSFNPTNPKSTFPLFSNDILINKIRLFIF